jgi:hypothetical protein
MHSSVQKTAASLGSVITVGGVGLAAALTAGCGLFQQAAPPVSAPVQPAGMAAPATAAAGTTSAPQRRVGDLFVHRFSGSFTAEPLTLTEEVVEREDTAWVVDFSLSQSEQVERLRVRFDAFTGEPQSVARLDGTTEISAKLGDYEALIARTIHAADVNEGLVSQNAQTCLVGSDALDCEAKTYKVWVGDQAATLSVVHAGRFADRDVSGEITSEDGKLIYRAELIEAKQGSAKPSVAAR